MKISVLAALALCFGSSLAMAADRQPILIAHRGASGERPEHTLEAYRLAIAQGADFIEPDLVLTRDGVLVARHENEISGTTDVADRPEFADRKTVKTIDGTDVSGWFTEDFTLAELKSLRAKERLPQLRRENSAYDGQFLIPTFEEVLDLAIAESAARGRTIGVYPETKHPAYFSAIGLPHEGPLLHALEKRGWKDDSAPVFIQSFEVANLKALRQKTGVRLIQLVDSTGGPADGAVASYADMLTPSGLRAIAAYADGIGPYKELVIPRTKTGELGQATALVLNAHQAGLKVHPWTFRAENYFLPKSARSNDKPGDRGNLATEIRAYVAAGVDGIFSDHVAQARQALSEGSNPR